MPPLLLTLKDETFYTAASEIELVDIAPTDSRHWTQNRLRGSTKIFWMTSLSPSGRFTCTDEGNENLLMKYTTLFLDLDDTLYPRTSGLWEAVGGRIQSYIEMKLNICTEDASLLRAQYLAQFGTTLNGLMRNHQVDPMEYLDYVHDVPVENLIPPDPELQTMLASITIPRIVFTNAYLDYAMRVLKQLGVSDLIDQVIDILALEFSNKPDPLAYHRALALAGNPSPATCLLVDDRETNLSAAAELGMTTVLVGDGAAEETIDYTIEQIHGLTIAVPSLVRK